jgi:mono/diheme cytochrome c family protein
MSDEPTPDPALDHNGDGHAGNDFGGTAVRREGPLYGVLAEYDTPGELVEAARKVRAAGYTEFDCYSPFPVHGIDDAMGIKRTVLPVIIFFGGLAGTVGGLYLQWWCNASNWPWNISGKPAWSIPANIPIGFETTILLAVFTSFFGMWIANKLPQVWHPFFRSERFGRVTDDAFLIGVEARDRRFDGEATPKLLADAGAISVESVHFDPDPGVRVMPKWITAFIVASTAFALIPFAIAAKARTSHSTEPHLHIFPDMDFQPKYKSDQPMDLFGDGRANRGEIAGTVARGSLDADDAFYRGIEHGADGDHWITTFPSQLVVNDQLIRRGKNRFEIYCTPCHGYDGRGMGAVPQRVALGGGAWQARNLVDSANPVAINMPNGQLFNTISNGYNTMMGYAAQIPHADRWAIVLYVRALQRSQNAALDDVPADHRSGMQMPEAPQ